MTDVIIIMFFKKNNKTNMIKIKKISVYNISLKLLSPFTTSFGTYQDLLHPFVEIKTVDGYTGYGEIPVLTDPAYKPESDVYSVLTSLEKFILPSVKKYHQKNGRIGSVEELKSSYQWIKGANYAKSGVESAFWDIIAQKAKKPLWKLWGGTQKEFMVGVSIGGKTVNDVLKKANEAVSLGYKRIKVKVWPGFELKVVKALRIQFPTILLQIDANSSYTLKNWKLLRALDEYKLLLIEQPLYDDDILYHSEISKKLETPICLDESIHSFEDVKRAIMLWDKNKILRRLIVNIKPPRVSGYQESIEIAKYCHRKGVRVWVGGMIESGWGKAFNLCLNSLKEINLPGDHFSPSGSYFVKDVVAAPLVSQKGNFTIKNAVSSGVELDLKTLKKLGKKIFYISF